MNDLTLKIITTTYSVLLPIVVGFIAKQMKNIGNARREHEEANRTINNKLDALTRIVSENQMRTSRYRIIRFDDEKASGAAHSSDHCDQILEDCDIYRAYCQEHPEFQNHKGQGAMKRIEGADKKGTLEKGGY